MPHSDLLLQTIQVLVMHRITLHGWQRPVNILTEKFFFNKKKPTTLFHTDPGYCQKKKKTTKMFVFCLCDSMTEL